MNILFVENKPEFKIKEAIAYLETNKINFSYNICKSINSALRYLINNKKEIDLIVLDLGLPIFYDDDNLEHYKEYGGLDIINEMCRKAVFNIPIIINSATCLDTKITKEYYSKIVIKQVDRLDGEWLLQFIKNDLNKKI